MTDQFADDLDRLSASLRELTVEAVTAAGYLRAELERLHPPTPADSPPAPSPPVAFRPEPRPASIVVPGTRKPDRNRIHVPDDEMDDDDRYFQEHRRRGWLE